MMPTVHLPQVFGRRMFAILALLAVLGFSLVWLSWSSSEGFSSRYPKHPNDQIPTRPPSIPNESTYNDFHPRDCRTVKGANEIFIAMKIGSSEAYRKLPQHLLTLFQCAPDYGVFSDLEQTVAGQYIYDAVADVDEAVKNSHKEFQYYRDVQELYIGGQDIATALQEKEKSNARLGWKLDKWKWLPIARKAYELHPDKNWYLFIEGDTAIIWTNLLQWIGQLDPRKKIYSGAQNAQEELIFAHGGSGVLVSRAAMRSLMANRDVRLEKWYNDTAQACCGDVVLGRHFLDCDIALTPSFPILQGEAPMTVDWNKRHMCAPSVSWHHVVPMDIDLLWQLQTNWTNTYGWNKPYLFRDLFTDYVDRCIREEREEWDNISAEEKYIQPTDAEQDEKWNSLTTIERQSVESFDDCRRACYINEKCLQFKYQPGQCGLGHNIRIGKAKLNSKVSSGWLLERIQAFKDQFIDCEANWGFDQ